MTHGTVRFDEALVAAMDFCRRHRQQLGDDPVLVRDVVGRIRLATPNRLDQPQAFWDELLGRLGGWSPGPAGLLLTGDDLLNSDAIFKSPDARQVDGNIRFLDRWVSGRDWIPRTKAGATDELPTIAFFGVKGGVGRSTALSVIARRLAEKGERVMVLDLDLESPGVSSLLLPEEGRPRFGVVDWLVESGVGQADGDLLLSMIATSPLAASTPGQIQVIPAAGETIETYVAKLARVRTSSDSPSGYGASLAALLHAIAHSDRPPSVVLLDCRAGIDDLAATAITSLATDALLFAVGTPQTWLAYRMLFSIWNKDARILESFRNRLQVVAGLVPETERDPYLDRLRNNAYDLFSEFVYDEEPPTDVSEMPVRLASSNVDLTARLDLFNFDLNDNEAPHFAVPVFWRRELQDFDPIDRPEAKTQDGLAAFDELVKHVAGCLPVRAEKADS
jgi:cellulose biosynthesis protein BcsQ